MLLVLFCLRFRAARGATSSARCSAAVALTPVLLYAASAMGVLAGASDAVRLALVMLVFVRSAWWRTMPGTGAASTARFARARRHRRAGFGCADWLVFRSGEDNLPVQLDALCRAAPSSCW